MKAYDKNENQLHANIRQDNDGTWSRNVWFGTTPATEVRRYYGYATQADAEDGDISEVPHGGRIGSYSNSKTPE